MEEGRRRRRVDDDMVRHEDKMGQGKGGKGEQGNQAVYREGEI